MARRTKTKTFTKNSNNTLALFVLLLIAFLVVVGMTSTPAITPSSATGEIRLVISKQPQIAETSGELGVVVEKPSKG
jgi:hypothetical protein